MGRLSRLLAIALTASLQFLEQTLAQDWPIRPVTMVIPYAAGSGSDVLGRVLAPRLSDLLGQQVIIENVGAAGGMTGSARVAKATPDGYQFVLGSTGSHAQIQTLYKKPSYNSTTDFTPVVLIADQPLVLVTRKDLPADNLQEFIAYAKANQANLQYGSAGTGSSAHLACLLLNAAIGLNVTHIPYRGGSAAMQDLIGGRIDYQCPAASVALPQMEGKLVKAIAVLTKNRSPILPSVGSAHEQGLTDFEAGFWNAIFLPKGTPPIIVEKLHRATVATMNTPAVQERLKGLGATLFPPEQRSPEYLAKFVASEIEKWAAPIKASGMSID